MRWSMLYVPTLREDPAEAEAVSHRLLLRGGFARQLMAGHYSLLPLGTRVHAKIERILREEMERIGGQEFVLPALHPAEIWRKTGRWDVMGEEMFRLRDRKGAELGLGMTHEEIFTTIAQELRSYRSLPQTWYQFQTKFRDEARPKGGLLRLREFTMKDSYSFDLDEAGLDRSFQAHAEAYERFFQRIGLPVIPVQASSGSMGGASSTEFMSRSAAGEDLIVRCGGCGYAANAEKAVAATAPVRDEPGPQEPEKVRAEADTVRQAAAALGLRPDQGIRTLPYIVDDELVLVLLRGDHELIEQKLSDALAAGSLRPATAEEAAQALDAAPGQAGPVGIGIQGVRTVADEALRGRTDLLAGTNEAGAWLRGVSMERDAGVAQWAWLRAVQEGEPCSQCGNPLEVLRTIEVGHIFKLGRKYTEMLGVAVLGPDGSRVTPIMGSYGIGLERAMAAVVEANHDEAGIIWPVSVAPYTVVVVALGKDEQVQAAVEDIYRRLGAEGVEVLLDDRDERPGVKFRDAELIGFPAVVAVGSRGLAEGRAEVTSRLTGHKTTVPLEAVVEEIRALIR
jgi:prolyl-tRNA synthetase